ncbi:Pfs, NACHT and ankyrin domain protein [Fusarium sp. MPI-SDFR-AT-0072]|nr:Pfs, NACHT and ankyrin domain protein [Fusarium sp. MPI-SDFR-AT-0072]
MNIISPSFSHVVGFDRAARAFHCTKDILLLVISALYIELAAACAMLDEVHEDLPSYSNDTNAYTLSSIERHNIVITCLPVAQYGANNAANALTYLVRTFPSIRLGLIVGIGGGEPSMADIRLGDIVGTRVMQYDIGKIIEDGQMQYTAILKIPHQLLKGSRITSILKEKFEGYPEYDHPNSPEYLSLSTYTHVSQILGCDECDHSMLVPRSRPKTDNPLIHYGAIASGNQVMRSGTQRDNIARQLDEWQRYAAAAAAAYTRELLEVLPVAESHSKAVYAPNPRKFAQLPWEQHEFD